VVLLGNILQYLSPPTKAAIITLHSPTEKTKIWRLVTDKEPTTVNLARASGQIDTQGGRAGTLVITLRAHFHVTPGNQSLSWEAALSLVSSSQ